MKKQQNSSRQNNFYENSDPDVVRLERSLSTNKAAEAACWVFSTTKRGRYAGRRHCSGNFSGTKTGYLTEDNDSTLLATFIVL